MKRVYLYCCGVGEETGTIESIYLCAYIYIYVRKLFLRDVRKKNETKIGGSVNSSPLAAFQSAIKMLEV